ncbi:MAG: TonB-dependent receptor plug domain-containing protein [Bryobacteraceae bacterium]
MRLYLALLVCAVGFAQDSGNAPATPPEQKQTVIVTGVYAPVPLDEADRDVNVIPLDTARKLLSNTLLDYLRLDSSVDVQARAPNGVSDDISIRGGSYGQTLVLLDGIRLDDAQSGHFDADIPIPPDAAGRIEILKGAGSAIYGSDAVGGAINVITSQPESSELHLRAAGGNFGVNQESGSLDTVWRNAAESLSFSRDFSTGFTEDRDYRNLSLSSLTNLKTRLGATEVLLVYNDRPFGAANFYGSPDAWERTRTWFAALRQELGKNTEASFAFRRHSDLYVLFRNDPAFYTNHHYEEGYQAALRRHHQLKKTLTVSYGGEAFRDELDSSNLGIHQRNYGAVYAAVDMRALSRYSFTIGAREEIFHGGARQFNPTAAAGAWLSPHWKVRASASRAFRLPNYTELYYLDPFNAGNPNLKPEIAWSYDGGLEWNAGERVRGDFGVFANRERNVVDFVQGSDGIYRAMNIYNLNFTGADASVKFRAAKTQWVELRYTAIHGAQAALDGFVSRYIFNYPVDNGTASWEAALPWGLIARSRVGALLRFDRDPYALWDMYLADRRGHWSPFVQLTNLTSTQYQEILGVAMPGRAVVAGLDYRLGW